MPLPKIPLDDPRVLALAKARQQFAHDCFHLPTWEELTDEDREAGLPTARNYLEAGINAGLFPAVELIDSGWRASLTNINKEIERQATAMATAAADLPLLLYRFRSGPSGGMSVGTVLDKLGETAEHLAAFAREFGDQGWVDMDQEETAAWNRTRADLEAAATAFRRTTDLIG
ncbi:hypothetical protein GCM10009678_79020 [Actinomadura kijaniata]|uniref:Uncharacterized protein n=1 Tax=Actinomadura namibiensis TaxID=182080 RepID=A0A7W3M0A1_ACTNM|nr:hypothetical protein [Actinomadura namibiensis]MBA8957504.1 hypothetical protein [Actinomadura namibiensis]